MGKLRFGTCSWKYESWQGLVYSAGAKENYLAEYGMKYDTVEIDQWFWSLFGVDKVSLPKPEVVREYVNSVNTDFRFTIKVPNSLTLTHFYRKRKTEPLIENPHFFSMDLFKLFIDLLAPMHSRIGLLMFQFEYLNKEKMTSQLQFLERMAEFFSHVDSNIPMGVEIRNPNYLNKKYFEFLQQHNLGHVFLQGYYMPDITPFYQKYNDLLVQTTAIRLHGPDRSDIEARSGGNWNRIYEPKDEELTRITRIIENMNAKNLDVYVNVNNHYEGSAPLTIGKIQRALFT